MNKPLPRLYPKKLETIGDHLRTKRLDLGLRQKDLENAVGACHATIKNWEKNYTEPRPHHIPLICEFLDYCPLNEPAVQHFGHQLRNYRVFTLGKTIFELATNIGVNEGTLSEIEQTSAIRHTHILNSINNFLEKVGWTTPDTQQTKFTPMRIKCKKPPKFHTSINMPETLGEHVALKRKQLRLTQVEAMAKIGIASASAYRSWELYGVKPQVKYFPKIIEFLGYCPIQFAISKGHRLKIMREHCGLSYREVEKILGLSKGCSYRTESTNNPSRKLVKQLRQFYRRAANKIAESSSYERKQ